MAQGPLDLVFRHIQSLAARSLDVAGIDEQLLRRFSLSQDEAAFAALVERHGPMVLGVCRRVLRREHDAEDAFQATFLTLARKAGNLRKPGSVGSWLHGVAYRIARKAQVWAARQPVSAGSALDQFSAASADETSARELQSVLDEELDRLPEQYRAPLILCCLQGRSRPQAARQLGWKEGTVSSRLARARAVLQARLARRGWTVSALGLAALIVDAAAPAAVPASLLGATARVAALSMAGEVAVPVRVGALVQGMLQSLLLARLKLAAPLVLLLGMLAAGTVLLASPSRKTAADPPQASSPKPIANAAPAETKEELPAGALTRLGQSRLQPGGSVQAVAYAPTGRYVASAGGQRIKLWDAGTGRLVRELPGHDHGIESLAFSPNGNLLASGGADWTARIWDVETGRQLQLLRGHRYGMLGIVHGIHVAFTPDGAALVTGGHEGVVQVWDVATGKTRLELRPALTPSKRREDNERVTALAVSPDGKLAATGNLAGTIHLWDLARGKLRDDISVQSEWVRDLKFSPDGKTLAWCGTMHSNTTTSEGICLYELGSGKKRLQLPGHNKGRTYGIAFLRDGRHLVSAGLGNQLKLWDLASGKEVRSFTGHTDTPWSVALSPDDETLASGSSDGSVRLWNVASGQQQFANLEGNLAQVQCLAMTAGDQTISTMHKDGRLRRWELSTGRLLHTLAFPGGRPEALAFSHDGAQAGLARGATVEVWDVAAGKRLWSGHDFLPAPDDFKFPRHRAETVVFSADGRRLLVASSDGNFRTENRTILRIWDAVSGKLLAQLHRPSNIAGTPLLSPDGQTLTLNEYVHNKDKRSMTQALRRFDALTGRLLEETSSQNVFGNASARTPDGKLLAIGTSCDQITFRDAITGAVQYTLQGPRSGANLSLMAFAPDGTRLAVAATHDFELVQIWDLTRARLTHELPAQATVLHFSPDGRKLATGKDDGTVLVWDLEAPAGRVPPRRHLSRQELEQRWTLLGSGYDTSRGNAGNYARSDAFAEGGDDAVAFLEEKLLDPELPAKDAAEAKRLAAPLADPQPAVRVQAMNELLKFGDHVYLATKGLEEAPATPAVQAGVERILNDNFEYRRSSHGSIDVLRQIASPRARQLLDKLSKGPTQTREQQNRAAMAGYRLKELEELRVLTEK